MEPLDSRVACNPWGPSNIGDSGIQWGNQDRHVHNVPEALLPQDTTNWKTTKYRINQKKALSKKWRASNRDEPCTYEETGEGLNVVCQAGLYELFRRAACQYYKHFNKAGLLVLATVQQDQDSSIVQVTFRVKTYGGQVAYTLDLYHTNSSIRLTGRNQHKFEENDWPQIVEIIQEMNEVRPAIDPETLNHDIRRCLEYILSNSTKPPQQQGKIQETATTLKTGQTILGLPPGESSVRTAEWITTGTFRPHQHERTLKTATMPMTGWTTPGLPPGESMAQSAERITAGPLPIKRTTETALYNTATPHHTITNAEAADADSETTIAYSAPGSPQSVHATGHTENQEGRTTRNQTPQRSPYRSRAGETAGTNDPRPSDNFILHHSHEDNFCANCEDANRALEDKERQLDNMQRKLKLQEKALAQREKDLQTKGLQYANSKAHIAALESQIAQLQETNRLLSVRLDQTSVYSAPTPPQQQPPQPNPSMEERLAALEGKVRDMKLQQLEDKILQLQQERNRHVPEESTHQNSFTHTAPQPRNHQAPPPHFNQIPPYIIPPMPGMMHWPIHPLHQPPAHFHWMPPQGRHHGGNTGNNSTSHTQEGRGRYAPERQRHQTQNQPYARTAETQQSTEKARANTPEPNTQTKSPCKINPHGQILKEMQTIEQLGLNDAPQARTIE